MPLAQATRIPLVIVTTIVALAAIAQARSVLAPLALALFIIGVVWPLQKFLQERIPRLLALAITIVSTILVCFFVASLAAWGFSRVGRSIVADTARYQAFYAMVVAWLESHGVSIAGIWAEHFNVTWLLRTAQSVTGRLNTTFTFWLIALLYVALGLLEVDDMRRKVERLDNRDLARVLLAGSAATAAKFRHYMMVRTAMSLATGICVGVFAWAAGLQFAVEWGVIAFVLNYIPFIGPFLATLFPTLLAMTQFGSWQGVIAVFAGLNIIQFIVGSYIEPRVAGDALSISPLLVLLTIFLWTFLWGLFGTFIGVPIALALLTFCRESASARWLADLLGGAPRDDGAQTL